MKRIHFGTRSRFEKYICFGKRTNFGECMLAGMFLLAMALFWANSSPFGDAGKLYTCLRQQAFGSGDANVSKEQQSAAAVDGLLKEYADTLWQRQKLLDLHGAAAKILHMQGYYSDLGIYVTDDGRIVSPYAQTSTDYEYGQLLSLKQELDQKGIRLIYVNEPTKYTDDHFFAEQFGVESYSNRNADLFLQRIRKAGVPVVDLREALAEEGMQAEELFYRTDHHWTVPGGFWATRKIAEALNQYCGYHIDLSVYDASRYSFTSWKNCWIMKEASENILRREIMIPF